MVYQMLRNFRLFKKLNPPLLGRWSVDTSVDITNRKIDLANYDSCGTCGIPPKNITMKISPFKLIENKKSECTVLVYTKSPM